MFLLEINSSRYCPYFKWNISQFFLSAVTVTSAVYLLLTYRLLYLIFSYLPLTFVTYGKKWVFGQHCHFVSDHKICLTEFELHNVEKKFICLCNPLQIFSIFGYFHLSVLVEPVPYYWL